MNLEELKVLLYQYEKSVGVAIVDVRSHEERKIGYIKHTIHVPLDEILLAKDFLETYQKIIFVCAHGMRAFKAFSLYESLGFKNLDYVDGSIEDWSSYKLPIETSNPVYSN
jgi:rhodanese-related sulfurtransferase